MSLKHKTIHGLFWSSIDIFATQGIQFIIGIILARILAPREFGLVGMLTIFIAVSQSFIDSGFSQALIRKNNCTQSDYSTVFYFNLAAGVLSYLLLFTFAEKISQFFDEPQLKLLIRVLGISLIISSFSLIQQTILTQNINFKLQTRISLISSISSGIVATWLALRGFGVWSLVIRTLTMQTIATILLWYWNSWKPMLLFSKKSFNNLFGFGSKLLLSGLLETIYNNIYLVIIGKYFMAVELGYFTRADQFKTIFSQNITTIVQRVSYPVLSSIQTESDQLLSSYKKLIRMTMFITFPLMFGLSAAALPLVVIAVGEKWIPSVIYLQLLSFAGMFYPLHAINLNMLKVKGRSDLFLRLEVIKKLFAIPVIVLGILTNIKTMIVGIIVLNIISYYLNSYYSGRLIGYSFKQQLQDIIPGFVLGLLTGIVMYLAGKLISNNYFLDFIIQLIVGIVFIFASGEMLKLKEYTYIKEIVMIQIAKLKSPRQTV
ncbi:MAG: lipopolysaccharide biosynthesis protein [Draconibacterium sp.]